MTTTKRGRAPSATDTAAAVPPSLPSDKAANRKRLAAKIKDDAARERRDSHGNVEEAKEPPPPPAGAAAVASPPGAPPFASSSPFWSAVERDALAALVAPEPVEKFLSETWERRPGVFRATEGRRALVERGEVFTKRALDAVVAAAEAAAAAAAGAQGGAAEDGPSRPPPPPPTPPSTPAAPSVLFGRDVCASRYRRGARENLGGEPGTPVTAAALRRLYGRSEEGDREPPAPSLSASAPSPPSLRATLQVHQPQRWCDASWRLVAALEARLGCLVGANAYLTPAASRGLAPHWDDVEVFVLQVEGAKSWKVWGWEPRAGGPGGERRRRGGGEGTGAPLASSPSGDLDERSLGEPALEVVLRPGDVLYLPRGTVHAAAADVDVEEEEGGGAGQERGEAAARRGKKRAKKAGAKASSSPSSSSSSNHLTLSSHQRWSLCDLALAAISAAAAVPPSCDQKADGGLPASLRPGLPPGFLSLAGFERGALAAAAASVAERDPSAPPPPLETAAALARGLRDLAEALERKSASSLRLLDGAADALAADFFASRLPPHPSQLLLGAGRAPRSAADSVAVRGKGLVRLVACDPGAGCGGGEGEGGGCGGEEEGEEEHGGWCGRGSGFVQILSCVRNERAAHLVPPLPSSSSRSPSHSSSSEEESEKEGSSGSGGGGSKEEEEEEESEKEESEGEEEEESEGDCSTLYPSSYAPALAQLLSSTPESPLEISRVALPSVEARLGLVYSLWSEGVLAVVEK